MVELRHELVDPLHDVLALLVRLEQSLLQAADVSRLLLDLAPQPGVLAAQPTVRLCERLDGALESPEVELLAAAIRNGRTPDPRDRTDRSGSASRHSRRRDALGTGFSSDPLRRVLAHARCGRPAGTRSRRPGA